MIMLPLHLSAANTPVSITDLPDPTLPPTVKIHAPSTIKLQSILHSGPRKSAVINGYVKTIGSYVNGGQVIDIKHNAVVINRNGQHYTLRLSQAKGVALRGKQP